MAHVSLKAEDCRIVIKNGKIRFQAMRHDLNGDVLEQVTISFPLKTAYKFAVIENLDEELKPKEGSNRIENFILDENND